MRDSPARLAVVCCEQSIMDCLADFYNGTNHAFAEAFLIADFLEQRDAADKYNLLGENLDLVDGTLRGLSFLEVAGLKSIIPY